jgi:hypothetical protein
MNQLFILLAISAFVIGANSARGQEFVVKDYKYRLVSVELSPRQAIEQAKKEALAACAQEQLGVQIFNLVQLQKQESDLKYKEKFTEFTQQFSLGFIRKYKTKDTSSSFDPVSLAMETTVTMDITLYKPENDDDLGLSADLEKSVFIDGEAAIVSYSLKKQGYIYLFDLNFKNQYCLIYETHEAVIPDKEMTFPSSSSIFELAMTKEETEGNTEFGSFVLVASEKPYNFGIKAAIENQWQIDCLDFDRFFKVLKNRKNDHSIFYLPYCIENKK